MKKLLILVILIAFVALAIYSFIFTGKGCGGFIGSTCPAGYECRYEDRFPDAMGKCAFSPKFLIIELLNNKN